LHLIHPTYTVLRLTFYLSRKSSPTLYPSPRTIAPKVSNRLRLKERQKLQCVVAGGGGDNTFKMFKFLPVLHYLSDTAASNRICITASGSNCHQLLAALGKRRKTHHFNHQTSRGFATSITKPPVETHHFNQQTSRGYSPLQSPNLPWKPPPINQATGGSHFLSIRQPVDNTWPGTWLLYLPHQLTPPSSTAKDKWTHILLHPFWA
jgi:hypothetical protein